MNAQQADDTSHVTWLVSSETANTAFYNSHGFMVVTQFVIGDDNPTWARLPITVSIVCLQHSEDS
jgi:hypothetical protein